MTNSVSKSATKKAAATKAPAKVAAKVATTKAPAKVAVKKVAAEAPVKKIATKAPTKKTAAAVKAPAKAAKKVAKKAQTTILAKVDIGFGNELFLRGSGSSLSWEKGALMTCLSDGSTWVLVLDEVPTSLTAKFTLNDSIWAQGEDVEIVPGQENIFAPIF